MSSSTLVPVDLVGNYGTFESPRVRVYFDHGVRILTPPSIINTTTAGDAPKLKPRRVREMTPSELGEFHRAARRARAALDSRDMRPDFSVRWWYWQYSRCCRW